MSSSSEKTSPRSRPSERGNDPLLSVKGLHTSFNVDGKKAHAVAGVSFDVFPGETFGIVGESGSGKSVASLSILRLVPDPPGRIDEGEILFRGQNLLDLTYEQMQDIRGEEIAMIFQEPMTSLNPVFTIGRQVSEPVRRHKKMSKEDALKRAVEVLERVGIPDAEKRLDDYPHQFSGGMRQRVMIAMALVCEPAILIADEPTTALDVTIQAQILDLMKNLQTEREDTAIILITHDLAVVAEMCDRVMVMYGGRIQEIADIATLFDSSQHPYTRGLMASIPHQQSKGKALPVIPGNVPSIFGFPRGCKFCSRCEVAIDRCHVEEPELREIAPGHSVRCHLVEEPTK